MGGMGRIISEIDDTGNEQCFFSLYRRPIMVS